ncbi:MAG: M20/M25/M40 family metallo-hydrolase [Cyclobacteriaceae bacterium]|nr:M20/M25/M40 family metallo-hydrolase [Cyclobacteriaceae bacterium]
MKKIILLLFAGASLLGHAQPVNKHIKEENVARVIKTLAADDMMGRSATRPEHIDKAAAFIESEFKSIGLTPLKGLKGFRQEFKKDMIVPQTLEVVINDQKIPSENTLLVTENTSVNLTKNAGIIVIPYDTAIKNTRQYLLSKAFNLTRDTATAFVLVAPEFKENFKELKGYFGRRFTSGRKTNKIFVLGVTSVLSYSVKATQKIETITMSNVAGMIPGKTRPDEYVVFSGHYDHIGIRPAIEGDSIANGADDDASGTTAVIELARYFKKIKNNNRTLIFVAFTAEEIGGYGSRYFSEQLNPDQVVAMFNIEMIGKPSKWGQNAAFITGYERSDFGEILQKNLQGTPFRFHPDPYPQQNLFYRSDNATLARLGVPAHTISTDEIDIDKFYHTVNDEVETLNMANITATIRAIALSAQSIVAGTDTPKRIDKSTVR